MWYWEDTPSPDIRGCAITGLDKETSELVTLARKK